MLKKVVILFIIPYILSSLLITDVGDNLVKASNNVVLLKIEEYGVGLVSDSFYLENLSLDDVFIESITTSCRCLTACSASPTIPVGGKIEISVSYSNEKKESQLPQYVFIRVFGQRNMIKVLVKDNRQSSMVNSQ